MPSKVRRRGRGVRLEGLTSRLGAIPNQRSRGLLVLTIGRLRLPRRVGQPWNRAVAAGPVGRFPSRSLVLKAQWVGFRRLRGLQRHPGGLLCWRPRQRGQRRSLA